MRKLGKPARVKPRDDAAQLRLIADNVPAMSIAYDENLHCLFANRRFAEFFGLTTASIVGKHLREIIGEGPYQEVKPYFDRVLDGHRATYKRTRHLDSGEERHLEVELIPNIGQNGRTRGLFAVTTDMTERNRAEDRLRESEERLRASNAQLQMLIQSAPLAIYTRDANGLLTSWNPAAEKMFGWKSAEVLGKPLPSVPEDARAASDELRKRLLAGETFIKLEAHRRRCDGSPIEVDAFLGQLRNGSGDINGIIAVVADITERKRAEDRLRESEERFRALTELSSDLYWETDAEHRFIQYSYGAKIDALIPVNELVGRTRWEIPSFLPDEEGWRAHRSALDAHLPFRDFELARRNNDGNLYYFSLSGEPIFDAGGAFTGYRGVGREITEQKTAEARLDRAAHYDTLTGLPNRALIHDRMLQAMARADRGQTLLTVMYLDLDRFKEINDSLGHAVGDEVLKEAARRVQSCLRLTDTVGRLGGDEFTVLAEDLHHVDEVSIVARKILDAFAGPAEVAGHELHLSISIGIAIYPLDGQDADTMLKHADIAMYQAKQEGRNNFQFYAPEIGARTERGADLRLRLHRALERGEFALHYQPQVHVTSGRITGVEALLRWSDAELGPVSPGQFIPVAEEMGLIVAIGDWVLREACRQCKSWLDAGLGSLRVAVNLSPRQFRQKNLAQQIDKILRETGLPAACLEIEITEGVVMKYAERAIRTLTELNQLGVQIAIDDFGTGYSSLAYLQRFPVHVLKIDQSFVQAIRDPTDQAPIVNTVIQLAKLLGLKALAEGVETAEQREYLRAHGCDAFQGYLFCKPQPAERIRVAIAQTMAVSAATGRRRRGHADPAVHQT